MNNPFKLALFTVLFWSFSSTLARLISLSSPYLLFSLSFACALVFFLIHARQLYGRKMIIMLRKIPFRYFLIGLMGYYAIWIGNTESFLSFDSAAETTVLNYTWLVFTVFFSQTLFSRPVKLNATVIIRNMGVLLCFISVYVLSVEGDIYSFEFKNTRGLLWGLMGGASYGLFSAYSAKIPKGDHLLFLIAAAFSSLLAMIITFVISTDSIMDTIYQITISDLLLVLAIGVLVDSLGYIMWTRSLQQAATLSISITKIASIVFILPVASLIIVYLVFGEAAILRLYFLVSLLLLICGIWFSQRAEMIDACLELLRKSMK